MIAQWRPPLSFPAKSEFLRVIIVTGLMARSTVFVSSSRRPSSRKHNQSVPVIQRVTDRLGEGGSTRDAAELLVEPDIQGLDERPAFAISHALTFLGGVTENAGLDRVQLGDPLHGFFGDRRFGRDEHFVELPSRVGPTESELWSIAGGIGDQAGEPGIAVDLDQAAITLQMIRRVNAFAIIACNT